MTQGAGGDPWAGLADRFADAYATVKGQVRTYVLHEQLLEHLPPPPGPVLDVGGGGGRQSFPLAEMGYDVTLLDPSPAMLEKASEGLDGLTPEGRRRVTLLQGRGEEAVGVVGGRSFGVVLCHGVLSYLEDPEPVVEQLCRCTAWGGIVSIMAGNAKAMAVRPALEGRWREALSAFEGTDEIGVLGVPTRAHHVEDVSDLLRRRGLQTAAWYGVWLFVDWLELAGVPLDPADPEVVAGAAAVELEGSRRDPYRQLSRVWHLVGCRPSS